MWTDGEELVSGTVTLEFPLARQESFPLPTFSLTRYSTTPLVSTLFTEPGVTGLESQLFAPSLPLPVACEDDGGKLGNDITCVTILGESRGVLVDLGGSVNREPNAEAERLKVTCGIAELAVVLPAMLVTRDLVLVGANAAVEKLEVACGLAELVVLLPALLAMSDLVLVGGHAREEGSDRGRCTLPCHEESEGAV